MKWKTPPSDDADSSANRLETLVEASRDRALIQMLRNVPANQHDRIVLERDEADLASRMLENEAFQSAIQALNEGVLQEIFNTEAEDDTKRFALWTMLRAITGIATALQQLISDYETSLIVMEEQARSAREDTNV